MPVIDRNILRLGAYEILYSDTPDRVAINEAIELSKRYGTQQSAQFVNGMLDRLMHARPSHLAKPAPRNFQPKKK
jgi:N utilization substance protein B